MLQQTRVDTVIPYYERFIEKYPTIEALANADEQELLKMWRGWVIIQGPNIYWRRSRSSDRLWRNCPKEKEKFGKLKESALYDRSRIKHSV